MSLYHHKSGAIKRLERRQRVYEEKKGSRSLFDVDLFEDTAELGSESEFGQDLQDIPTPTAVIGTPRQASEELIDFGIYRAADDGVADEDDVNVDDNIDKHQTPLTEDEMKNGRSCSYE